MTPDLVDKFMRRPPGDVAQMYVDLRAQRDALRASEKRITTKMESLASILQAMLDRDKQGSFRTQTGYSIYPYEQTRAQVHDPMEFREYVKKHMAFDLMEIRASTNACETFAGENNGEPPPGVTINRIIKLGVRKGK